MILTSIQFLNELLVIFLTTFIMPFYNGHFFAVQFRLISRHRDNGRFIDMETCNESISSLFDDSSHSESNTKEECCDGDDELTDVEGGNEWKL